MGLRLRVTWSFMGRVLSRGNYDPNLTQNTYSPAFKFKYT